MKPVPILRRPVPLAQYLRYLGNRTALFSTGGAMTLMGAAGLLLIGLFVVSPTRCDLLMPACSTWPLLLLLLFPISLSLMGWGERTIGRARHMEALAPWTRHNIDLLPDQHSLVRASMRTSEKPAAVLLRPSGAAISDPPEQLLRVGNPNDLSRT